MRSSRVSGIRRTAVALAVLAAAAWGLAACGGSSSETAGGGRVLLVGTFMGHSGQYKTIQAAVDAAKSGDWILVAPGDYHEHADSSVTSAEAQAGNYGGVIIRTPDVHLRGMNRDTVIVDGTLSGSSVPCDRSQSAQDLGTRGPDGRAWGRNGIVVYKASGVTIDNLTVCNFLNGAGNAGNEIWWNGGADSAKIGMGSYSGSYLTATSTYYGGNATAAAYGVFSNNANGPGRWDQVYTSNFNDSGLYIGACQQVCNAVIDHAWSEYSALGYSGSNSGGSLVVENSQFDNNKDGFDTNSQNSADPPTPQNGACPNGGSSPITHTHSCWVFIHNYVHDNNNPNVPQAGSASQGPVGTGMTISGGRNDTVMDNQFANNGAWGTLFVPYPDTGKPANGQHCQGGVQQSKSLCLFDDWGNALIGNTFSNNGFFGNPSNSDFGQITFTGGHPQNCFSGNTAPNGSAPPDLEQTQGTCGPVSKAANMGGPLLNQALCDTGVGGCPPGAMYPRLTVVAVHPLPGVPANFSTGVSDLPSMPNPCEGVPSNAWCSGGRPS